MPTAGKVHTHSGAKVRSLLLRATRNHVYYVDMAEHVLVVAVWGAVKGSGPDLKALSEST